MLGRKIHIAVLLTIIPLVVSCTTAKFEPNAESLKQYECPDWFRDARLGIYVHWGVYSVAERGEWYGRRMYKEEDPVYAHHVETCGHPSEFGYKDFIPMWKVEAKGGHMWNLHKDRGLREIVEISDETKRAGPKTTGTLTIKKPRAAKSI